MINEQFNLIRKEAKDANDALKRIADFTEQLLVKIKEDKYTVTFDEIMQINKDAYIAKEKVVKIKDDIKDNFNFITLK